MFLVDWCLLFGLSFVSVCGVVILVDLDISLHWVFLKTLTDRVSLVSVLFGLFLLYIYCFYYIYILVYAFCFLSKVDVDLLVMFGAHM